MKMTGFYMKCDTGMKWINDLGSMLNCWNAETTTRAALILKKFDYETTSCEGDYFKSSITSL